ncbi:hypothetical protein GCM10023191_030500 [Actinoallomurus oryzae]|uniref:Uncharacterized protein n=1 Tax=Actinoallomurus oryzae TaxID=502180 RepID=A0ABP8PWV6_9ACTN
MTFSTYPVILPAVPTPMIVLSEVTFVIDESEIVPFTRMMYEPLRPGAHRALPDRGRQRTVRGCVGTALADRGFPQVRGFA